MLAAQFNAMIGKTEIAEGYLVKARDVVGADYPSIRLIDLLIAQGNGNEKLADELKTELLELAKHVRVGMLSFPIVQWHEEQIGQICDIAVSQRHREVLAWTSAKPSTISSMLYSICQQTRNRLRAMMHQ